MVDDPISTVLVVDTDEDQRLMIQTNLQKHGFKVLIAEDAISMREQMTEAGVNLVLIDVTMPGEDGFELTRYLRERYNIGIIMLSVSAEYFERIEDSERGADDYLSKPFESRELLARVKAVLRRTGGKSGSAPVPQPDNPEGSLALGDFHLNFESRELRDKNNDVISVTSMEFDLLKVFAENPGRVLTRDNLLSMVHKGNHDPFDRSVDNRIGRVRRKIENDPSKPSLIKTVRGVGYIYVKK